MSADMDLPGLKGQHLRKPGKLPAEKPQWMLGSSGGWAEKLNGLFLLLVALAGLWLEPGFNRPLRLVAVLLSCLSCSLAAVSLGRTRLNARILLTFMPLFGWWGFSTLSCLGSLDAYRSQETIVYWTGAVGVFLLAAVGFSSGKAWRATLTLLTASSAFFCLVAILSKGPQQSLTGTFTNRDTFSVIPMTSTFLALALARSPGAPLKMLAGCASIAFALITLASGSRAGALGMLLGLGSWLASLALHRDPGIFRQAWRHASRALLVLTILGFVGGIIQPLIVRFGEALNGKDIQGVTMRHDVLVHGMKACLQHPWLGNGPGTFALAYQEFRPQGVLPDYMFVNYAHNDYIEMLVEVGFPGFLCWMVFGFLVVARGIRLIRYSTASWECSCLIAALVSMGVFATLNFILPVPAVLLWQMIILGMLQGLPSGPRPAYTPNWPQTAAAILIFGMGLLGCISSFKSLRASRLVKQAQSLTQALRWEEAISVLDQALACQPKNLQALIERGRLLSKMGQFQRNSNWIKQAEANLETAGRLSPRDQEVSSARIQFYLALRNYSKAEELVQQVHRYTSYREWPLPKLAELQVIQGKLEAAARSLYSNSLDNEKSRKYLPVLLSELEKRHTGASINLLREWSGREGDASVSRNFAKEAAELALAQKQALVAERFLEFLLAESPQNTEAQYLLSKVYALLGQKSKQKKLLESLVAKASPTKNDKFVDSALLDLSKGQSLRPLSPELQVLEQRLKQFPQSVPLRLAVSQAYLDHKQWDKAAEVAAAGLDSGNDDPDLLARMGTCLARQGLPDLARKYFEQALKVSPKHPEAQKGLENL